MRVRQPIAPAFLAALLATASVGNAGAFTSGVAWPPAGVATAHPSTAPGKQTGYGGTLHGLIMAEIRNTQLDFLPVASGTTLVRFIVDRRGRLQQLDVLSGSGYKRIDDYVQRIVKQAARRFPPAPANQPGEAFAFALPIRFN